VVDPSDVVIDELADASGGIAFLVHLGAKEVRDRQQSALVPGQITALLDHAIGDLDHSHQMTAFLTRLNRHYGADADLAAWLLDQLAAGPQSRPELLASNPPRELKIRNDDHLRTILDWLRLDHYLDVVVGGGKRRYDWRYPALRRVWVLRRL
jgi:hypothetical protein